MSDTAPREVALRYNQGKPKLHYMFTFGRALEKLTAVLDYGAKKYAAYNYTKGADAMQSVDCLLRHLKAWVEGEDLDPESGCSHLGHVVFNALQLAQCGDHAAFDNRPHNVLAAAASKAPEGWRAPAERKFNAASAINDAVLGEKNAPVFNWVPMFPFPQDYNDCAQKCEVDGYVLRVYSDLDVEVNTEEVDNELLGSHSEFLPSYAADFEGAKRYAEGVYLFRTAVKRAARCNPSLAPR